MTQLGFKKYLIQFLFQHPELIELQCKDNYYQLDEKIKFDISSVISFIQKEINKKTYCFLNVKTHNKMYDILIQFFKIMEKNLRIKTLSPSLQHINLLLKYINQVREVLDQFKLKKLFLFKLMFNRKSSQIVGLIGLPITDGTWLFWQIDLLIIIVNTSLFKFLKENKNE